MYFLFHAVPGNWTHTSQHALKRLHCTVEEHVLKYNNKYCLNLKINNTV